MLLAFRRDPVDEALQQARITREEIRAPLRGNVFASLSVVEAGAWSQMTVSVVNRQNSTSQDAVRIVPGYPADGGFQAQTPRRQNSWSMAMAVLAGRYKKLRRSRILMRTIR